MTDEFSSYNLLDRTDKYVRLKIDHNKLFSDGFIHTNTVESFWATLKRGVYGIYHQISPKYLQQYVNEFTFRHNNRNNPEMFNLLLKRTIA
ncbi:MAG TPA: transposase [Cytophagaceae bacterium]|nr:transposase [Cytophagaceae bacterium]